MNDGLYISAAAGHECTGNDNRRRGEKVGTIRHITLSRRKIINSAMSIFHHTSSDLSRAMAHRSYCPEVWGSTFEGLEVLFRDARRSAVWWWCGEKIGCLKF